MSLSIQDWMNLDKGGPADVAEAMFEAARRGDWESIEQAERAGMLDPNRAMLHTRSLRMVAALSILDTGRLTPERQALTGATLQQWLSAAEQGDKDAFLTRAVKPNRYYPEACRSLLKAGANPYASGPKDKPDESCINAIFDHMDRTVGLALMKLVFGDEPITHSNHLPALYIPGPAPWDEPANLLEYAAQRQRYDVVDWLRSRIVPDSAGEDILLELGNKVLRRLWLDADGRDVAQEGMSMPPSGSTDVVLAQDYVAASAALRDPTLWSKVARKTVATDGGERIALIDWIASDLTAPLLRNSATGIARRERTLRVFEAFIENGAIGVDERIRENKTLLMHAAWQGEASWAEYLLEKGANPLLKTTPGPGRKARTASQLASHNDCHDCAKVIDAFVARRAISRVLAKSRQQNKGAKS